MSDWLTKAKNVFKREVPQQPQPFEVICQCGTQHAGYRRSRHQHLICKSCGRALFVLPRDIYPAPVPIEPSGRQIDGEGSSDEQTPTRTKPVKRDSADLSLEVQADTDADFATDLIPPEASSRPASLPRAKPTKRQLRRRRAKKAVEKVSPAVVLSQGPSLPRRLLDGVRSRIRSIALGFLRFWTPLRSIACLVCLVLGFTVLYSIQRQLLARAESIAQAAGDQGLSAVQEGDWVTANQQLTLASHALDRLDRVDAEAQKIRQYRRETEAIIHLSGETFIEIVDAAEKAITGPDTEAWQHQFERDYRGQWIVIEGVFSTTETVNDDSEKQASYQLRLPWGPSDMHGAIEIEANFPAVHRLQPAKNERLVLAGQLARCDLNAAGNAWHLVLNPDTGFLWGHLDTCQAVGLGFDTLHPQKDIETQLKRQLAAMEAPR